VIDEINRDSIKVVRAVAFDIGGVLIEINRNWEDALFAAGIRNGVVGTLAAFPAMDEFQLGAISEDEYLEHLQGFLRLDSREQALHVHNLILKHPYPGTLELIEELNERGVVTACLSNTNSPHWVKMRSGEFPNIDALQLTAVSQELNLSKPDPAIFEAFESLANARPCEIVFFDDMEDNVEAARERGWRAYWIDHSRDTAEQMELILIAEGVLPAP